MHLNGVTAHKDRTCKVADGVQGGSRGSTLSKLQRKDYAKRKCREVK